jgi:hypothetical protein
MFTESLPSNYREDAQTHRQLVDLMSHFLFLAYFPHFENMKVDLWDNLAACVCLSLVPSPLSNLNAWINLHEIWYVYSGTWAHINRVLHKSFPSVCVSVCESPHIVTRQRLGKCVPAVRNTRNNRRIVRRVVFYTVHVVSTESLWVCLCIPNFSICTAEAVVWNLLERSDSIVRSWFPWD